MQVTRRRERGKRLSGPHSASDSSTQAEPQPPQAVVRRIEEAIDASRFESTARMSMFNAAQGMVFHATVPSRHNLTIDIGAESGGSATGPEPLELLLVSLGTCTGLDVISILRKKRQAVTAYTVNVYANQAAEHPKIYTEILVEHLVTGHDVAPTAVARSIELSVSKYCPVSAMLSKATKIEHVFHILDSSSGSPSPDVVN